MMILITNQGLIPSAGFYGTLLGGAGWGLVPHQQRPNMLLPIPRRHTTLSTKIYCLMRSQKANSYPVKGGKDIIF